MNTFDASSRPFACDTAICTLFEGDYHLGLAAILNSLVRAGYAGTVWADIAARCLPGLANWSASRMAVERTNIRVTDRVRLVFSED